MRWIWLFVPISTLNGVFSQLDAEYPSVVRNQLSEEEWAVAVGELNEEIRTGGLQPGFILVFFIAVTMPVRFSCSVPFVLTDLDPHSS